MTLLGVDISNNDSTVDWNAVVGSGRTHFGFCKATERTDFKDSFLAANRDAMHAHGYQLVGLYHFARPGQHSAKDEAAHFLDYVGAWRPNEVAVLDFEDSKDGLTPAQRGAWATEWLTIVQQASGRLPGFYTYAGMLSVIDTSQVSQHSWLWVAAYQNNEPSHDRWDRWTMWQYTDAAHVPGVRNGAGSDDSKFYTDDIAALAALGGGQGDDMTPRESQLLEDLHAFMGDFRDSLLPALKSEVDAIKTQLEAGGAGGAGGAPTKFKITGEATAE